MKTTSQVNIFQKMINSAILGGEEIMKIYQKPFSFQEKKDGSPVTQADIRCEEIIYDYLHAMKFKLPFIGEESLDITKISPKITEFYCVDPLDGTKEFIKRNGEFTVNVAWVKDNYPIFGVIFAPVSGILYFGGKDFDAFRLDYAKLDDDFFKLATKITIKRQEQPQAIISRSHCDQSTASFIEKYSKREVIRLGSSLKFCYISEGRADFYPRYGRTMEWDTASGQAILEGAGGEVLELTTMKRLAYGKFDRGFDNPAFLACSQVQYFRK